MGIVNKNKKNKYRRKEILNLLYVKKNPNNREKRQEAEEKLSHTSRHHCIQKPSCSAQC